MSRENLLTLANYLDSLPEDYQHFHMQWFTGEFKSEDEARYALENGGLDQFGCDTVACAVGHGPSAGFLFTEDLFSGLRPDWKAYCDRFFLPTHTDGGRETPQFLWCFGSEWADIDDHHYGAAARIRYMLDHDGMVPIEDWLDVDEDLVDLYKDYRRVPAV